MGPANPFPATGPTVKLGILTVALQSDVRVLYLVKRLKLAIRANMDGIVRQLDVTTVQYTALSVLRLHPGMSSAQLARRSFVSAQAGNELAAALERKGLVSRQADEANKRVLRISLTEQGAAVLRACDEQIDVLESRMLAGLSAAQYRQFRNVLDTCIHSLGPAAG